MQKSGQIVMAVSEEIISEIWRDQFIDNISCGIFDDDCSTNDDCDKDNNLGKLKMFRSYCSATSLKKEVLCLCICGTIYCLCHLILCMYLSGELI